MKRTKNIFSLLLCSLVLLGSCEERNVTSILNKYGKITENLDSWEYDVHYRMKYFDSENDTLNYFSKCRLVRSVQDTIFGGAFWINNDSVEWCYDLEHIYVIEHNEQKITRYFPHNGQDWVVRGHTINGVLDSYFFKPKRFSNYLKDSITSILVDTTINDTTFHSIQFKFPEEPYIQSQIKTFYFDIRNRLKDITYLVESQNEWQYNEWHFSNEKDNTISLDSIKLELDSLFKIYSLEEYTDPEQTKMIPLKNGIVAPNFEGVDFESNQSVEINTLNDKVVILDFWFKDCFPCIEATHFLNSIREKYPKDKLEILGINPVDDRIQDKKKIVNFIKSNEMNYPAIFVEKEVQNEYNVHSFPSLYIIDKDRKVVFSSVGHSDEKEIEEILDHLIN